MRTMLALALLAGSIMNAVHAVEPPAGKPVASADAAQDAKMAWWREARFGMFIHWGLYAVPAGAWPGKGTGHAEWIRDTANIPVGEYEKLLSRFNPVKFDADQWAALAQEAGFRYMVITSKHHDGFCLFDSAHTDWDVMSSPFKRDIMKELSDACKKLSAGKDATGVPRYPVRFCMYHSIMDWHHPDYLPRRPWEKAARGTEGADFERFVAYLKAQLAEVCAPKYDPGLIWFDGEWEGTWTHERGKDLVKYMNGIAPNVIFNNRIDKGRAGMAGETARGFLGDYHTPEQTIPENGLEGDWETCMTMNGNWGYNAADRNFKSTTDLIQKLCDISSKGGNFLLNVGPTAEGEIPAESVQRLKEIGAWMRVNGGAIYGTERSPLDSAPAWGRVTYRAGADSAGKPVTTLYLHVFEWPQDGKLTLSGFTNAPLSARLLGVSDERLSVTAGDLAVTIGVPEKARSPHATVVELTLAGPIDPALPPTIDSDAGQFIESAGVRMASRRAGVTVRYTTDGTEPTPNSPAAEGEVRLVKSGTIKAACFAGNKRVSRVVSREFVKVTPAAAMKAPAMVPGLDAAYYEGTWKVLPDFATLTPIKKAEVKTVTIGAAPRDDSYAVVLTGYITAPEDAVYTFGLLSDDGSKMWINGSVVIDNDGLHSAAEKQGTIALAKGVHEIRVEMFEATGGADLKLAWSRPGAKAEVVPAGALSRPKP